MRDIAYSIRRRWRHWVCSRRGHNWTEPHGGSVLFWLLTSGRYCARCFIPHPDAPPFTHTFVRSDTRNLFMWGNP